MKKLLIANWKQNKNKEDIRAFFEGASFLTKNYEVVVAPSFPYLAEVSNLAPGGVKLAAQDVSMFPHGSYTGEVGAFQLKDLGVSYVIIGHSERRKYFNETNQQVNNKVLEVISAGMIPVVCFNDISELRSLEVETKEFYLAFEPSEAIGGTAADSAYENETISTIFDKAIELFPEARLMYGASVNNENIDRLKNVNNLSGFLVGTASLDRHKFMRLCQVL